MIDIDVGSATLTCSVTGLKARVVVLAQGNEANGTITGFTFIMPPGWLMKDGAPVSPLALPIDVDSLPVERQEHARAENAKRAKRAAAKRG